MKNIRIALFACLALLLITACRKEDDQLMRPEVTSNLFMLKSSPFTDNNNSKVYLNYGDPSKLIYEDGDKVRICNESGVYKDFVVKYRTTSDGQSPAVTSDGWYAQSNEELTGSVFYAVYVDGFKNYATISGSGPAYTFNINSIREYDDYDKIILSGNTETNAGGTVLTLTPACAILRLNTQGAGNNYNYVKVGFEADKVPKKGTINASTNTLTVSGNSDYLTGVTAGGAGEFLYMRHSNTDAGEDDYWYVAIPIKGSSVTTTLYLEWNNGSETIKYRTSGQVTMEKGRVYTVGTERSTPFTAKGYTKSYFSTGDGHAVAFSAGNLQARTRLAGLGEFVNEWQLASAQTVALKDNNTQAGQNNVWLDLLGYGTSGELSTAQPNTASTSAGNYPSGNIAGSNNDWGVKIGNTLKYGSTTVTGVSWRTLTRAEWESLIGRTGKVGLATITIDANTYKGLVLLPDYDQYAGVWTMPEGASFNASVSGFNANTFNASDWSVLENAGAVFLPVTYYRTGTSVSGANEGYYWTSTGGASGAGNPSYALKITSSSVSVVATTRPTGCAVRLVATAF